MKLPYYIVTASRDTFGSKGSLVSNALIVSGICLFILLLIGLKRGLIEQLRADILKSPTAREVKVWATSADLAFDARREAELERTLHGNPLVIPSITKVASLTTRDGRRVNSVTLQCTKVGDPFLAFYGLDTVTRPDRSIVLSRGVAEALDLPVHSTGAVLEPSVVTLEVARLDDAGVVKQTIDLQVRGILAAGGEQSSIAWLNRQLLDWIEDFSQGRSVPEVGWPGRTEPPKALHDGYLAFCKAPYHGEDLRRLHLRGLRAQVLSDNDEPDVHPWRVLFDLLRQHELPVYWVTADRDSETRRMGLDFDPEDLETITSADDIFYPWSRPRRLLINGEPHVVIGVTGPLRWLRGYFLDPRARLEDNDPMRVMLPTAVQSSSSRLEEPGLSWADVQIADGVEATLAIVPTPAGLTNARSGALILDVRRRIAQFYSWLVEICHLSEDAREVVAETVPFMLPCGELLRPLLIAPQPAAPGQVLLAVTPAAFMAHMSQFEQGNLIFDDQLNQFVSAPVPNQYYEGRIYASTLDDVPALDQALRDLGYSTVSSKTRVREMQGYAGTLDLLVWLLQGVAFGFGAITVSIVFMDVTRRKRGSIGIMRIMGMPPLGVFCFVFVRALIVGFTGWTIGAVVALGLAAAIPAVSTAKCDLTGMDLALVLVGALFCCASGVMLHAWHAANRLDPCDAIMSGKNQ